MGDRTIINCINLPINSRQANRLLSVFILLTLFSVTSHTLNPFQPSAIRHEKNMTPFDDLLNAITQSLGTSPKPILPHLHSLLRAYSSNPDHWAKYAHRNPSKQYTRNLVCELPGIFNLLILVWTPGQASPIHDHADSHCLMKVRSSIREKWVAMLTRVRY